MTLHLSLFISFVVKKMQNRAGGMNVRNMAFAASAGPKKWPKGAYVMIGETLPTTSATKNNSFVLSRSELRFGAQIN